jgi:translation initiation factor 3 subunit I
MSSLFDFQKPEVTTIVRWLLRVILVLFLAWLVRRKPEEEEEDEEPQQDQRQYGYNKGRNGQRQDGRNQQNGRYPQQQQQHQRRDQNQNQYQNQEMRQRRSGGQGGNGMDFDAVIDKMSKPKDMWDVRKAEDGTPQVRKRPIAAPHAPGADKDRGSSDEAGGHSTPTSLAASLASLTSSIESLSKPSVRKPVIAPRREKLEEKKKEAMQTLHGHERPVTCISWNKDCNLLFTCGKDKIVCVWSFPEGEQLGVYKGHSGAVWACSMTDDSQWLATSAADQLVIVWEARTSLELARKELPGVVRSVEWASGDNAGQVGDGAERFVTAHNKFGSKPPALTVFKFSSDTIEEQLQITGLPTGANQVRWGPGNVLASAHENGVLIFWRADTGDEVRRLEAHTESLSKFDFSDDREVAATVSRDHCIKVWNIANLTEIKLLYELKTDRPLNAVALGPLTRGAAAGPPGERPDRCTVIAAGGADTRDIAKTSGDSEQFGTLMYKLGAEEELPGGLVADGVTKGHFGPVHTLAFTRDGSAIASGSEDGCVRFHIFEPKIAGAGASPDTAQGAEAENVAASASES